MSQTALSLLLAVIAAVSGGVVTWAVARRKNSGAIDTSDAGVLWSEGQQMRKELRDEVVTLRSEVTDLKDEVAGCRREMSALQRALVDRTDELDQLHEDNRRLRIDNAVLRQRLPQEG